MDIIPILQTFRHNKAALALIMAQVAFTLAVLVNALVVISTYRDRMNFDSGINDRRVVLIEAEPVERTYFDSAGDVRNDAQAQIDQLRGVDGLQAVSQVASFPLSGQGAMRPSWPEGGVKEKAVRHSIYAGDAEFLAAFGLQLVAGRNFKTEEVNWAADPVAGSERAPVIIISRELGEQLFPGVDPVGKQIESEGGQVDTIIGLVDRMPGRHVLMNTVRLSAVVPARPLGTLRYAALTPTDVSPGVLERVSNELAKQADRFEFRVTSLSTEKQNSMHYLFLFGSILGVISLLLMLVTAIGSYSQAAYSVGTRIRQIGTRRAFGASRLQIVRYFLLENWLTTTFGLLAGVLFANAVSFVLNQAMELPRMGSVHVLAGVVFLWVVGAISTLVPALRAARVPPAIATRGAY